MATNPEVFADTSGWAAAFVRSEGFHALAAKHVRHWHAAGVRIVTTNDVVAELTALLIQPLRVDFARRVHIVEAIRTAPWVEVVHVDPGLTISSRPDSSGS